MKPMSLVSARGLGALIAGVAVSGCSSGPSFDSPESAARLGAIQRAGAQGDRSAIPRLIEMLESDDPAVRLTAIGVLEEMTGERLGYDPIAPTYERSAAVERWYEWWEGRSAGASGEASSGGSEGDRRGAHAEPGTNAGVRALRGCDAAGAAYRNKDLAGGVSQWGRGGLVA